MKFYLKVPYHERHAAKAAGALWEPSTKRWYCVSGTVLTRCQRWSLPLRREQKEYLDAPERTAAYSRAMESYKSEVKTGPAGERRMLRSTSRGGSR